MTVPNPAPATTPAGRWRAVAIIAARELRTKLSSKAYIWSTVALVAAMIGGGALFNLINTTPTTTFGVTEPAGWLSDALPELAADTDHELTFTTIADRDAGEAAITAGELDVVVTVEDGTYLLVSEDEPPPVIQSLLTTAVGQYVLNTQLTEAGADPDQVAAALAQAGPELVELDPRTFEPERLISSYLIGLLLFLGLMLTGQALAQGVVEEKANRIVELMLVAVKPWQLMVGKVSGIGIVGIIQVGLTVAAAVFSALTFNLVEAEGFNVFAIASGTLGWFLLGYICYALALAALASLVSRQEDLAAAITPVTIFMMVPYVVSVSLGPWEPNHLVMQVMSWLPFTSPFVMPVRMAATTVPWWEVAVAAGLSLAIVPALVWFASRVYNRSILATGSRLRLREVLATSAPSRARG